jgi:5-methylcytosine-specific restriction endonuclease McrA
MSKLPAILVKKCLECGGGFTKHPHLSYKQWDERILCSKRCAPSYYSKNYRHSPETRALLRLQRLGVSTEHNKGPKSHFWRGGRTKEVILLRESARYGTWRRAVYERDDFTCQGCKRRGGRLNADHIKSFARFPELRFELSNGRTLCEDCHRKTSTFGGLSRI